MNYTKSTPSKNLENIENVKHYWRNNENGTLARQAARILAVASERWEPEILILKLSEKIQKNSHPSSPTEGSVPPNARLNEHQCDTENMKILKRIFQKKFKR